ncbi:hypothetical protein ACK1VC_06935 [Pseudomonas sp. XP2]|uniref:hypothetical protein n=1 Tax=Pseudomonas TaxID=286 RepID=UPI0006CF9257|nr:MULTISPECIES: hypothetical protein [Pseudomonas]MCE1053424.1 hypothetical protein [Pseudomonas alloputida]PJX09698.1 hypothetical protein CQW32_14675 [Pseudomonas putida]UWH20861.1 hypothetical protein KW568_17645 [Pseudomonas sp. HD6515]
MRLIIVLLLIIIFILAPWLIVVAIGAAAVYGVYVLAASAVAGLLVAIFLLRRRPSSGQSPQMREAIRRANRQAKEKSDLAWVNGHVEQTDEGPAREEKAPDTVRVCRDCQVEVMPGEFSCSSCRKKIT